MSDDKQPPCNNFGETDDQGEIVCMNRSVPEFTVDFTDVEKGCYFYFCSECGPREREETEAFRAELQRMRPKKERRPVE